MNEIFALLLAWLAGNTGYPPPDGRTTPPPRVERRDISHAGVQKLCGAVSNCTVDAFYVHPPREQPLIVVDTRLNLETNVCAQSVLLHETVHWLQDVYGYAAQFGPATKQNFREQQAYTIQQRFLNTHGAGQWNSRNLPMAVNAMADCRGVTPEGSP